MLIILIYIMELSLPALVKLGKEKGYALVTCNSAGNNAFFVNKKFIK